MASGAVGQEEFNHVSAQLAAAKSSGVAAAQSALQAAREQLASNQTRTEGTAVDQHPNVLRAGAQLREAWLARSRAELLAPIDGFVAKRSVQLGHDREVDVGAAGPRRAEVGLDPRDRLQVPLPRSFDVPSRVSIRPISIE